MKTQLNRITLAGVLMTSSFTALTAHAQGGSSTHGGDVVACFRNGMADTILARIKLNRLTKQNRDPIRDDGMAALEKVDLYDFYEKKNTKNTVRIAGEDLIQDNRPYLEILKDREENLKNTHYYFWANYFKVGKDVIPLDHWHDVPNGVAEVDDSNDKIQIPNNCLRLQIANQVQVGAQVHVNYDTRLFKRLSSVDQAGLYTHEWVYYPFIHKFNEQNSLRPRALNVAIYQTGMTPSNAEAIAKDFSEKLELTANPYQCFAKDECLITVGKSNVVLNRKENGLRSRHPGMEGTTNDYYFERPMAFAGVFINKISYATNGDVMQARLHPVSYPKGVDSSNDVWVATDSNGHITSYQFKVGIPSTVDGVRIQQIPGDYELPYELQRAVTVLTDANWQLQSVTGLASLQDHNQTVQCLSVPEFYHSSEGATFKQCVAGTQRINSYDEKSLIQSPLKIQNVDWIGKVYFKDTGDIDVSRSTGVSAVVAIKGVPALKVETLETVSCGKFCSKLLGGELSSPWTVKIPFAIENQYNYLEVDYVGRVKFGYDSSDKLYLSSGIIGWQHNHAVCGDLYQVGGLVNFVSGSSIEYHPNGMVKSVQVKGGLFAPKKHCGLKFKTGLNEFDEHGNPID